MVEMNVSPPGRGRGVTEGLPGGLGGEAAARPRWRWLWLTLDCKRRKSSRSSRLDSHKTSTCTAGVCRGCRGGQGTGREEAEGIAQVIHGSLPTIGSD